MNAPVKKSRARVLAEQLLRDRAERAARKAVRTTAAAAKTERLEFDPFAVTRWRVIAGGDSGYLFHTSMCRGPVGWLIACRACARELESKGWAYCPTCMELPAEERRDQPKKAGRQCQGPGCGERLSIHARADARYCSVACRKAASRDKTASEPSHSAPPEMSQLEGSESRIKRASLIGPKDFPINIVGGRRLPQEKPNPLGHARVSTPNRAPTAASSASRSSSTARWTASSRAAAASASSAPGKDHMPASEGENR
jgi:hypothetical protein